jgi:hypothetical protein
MAFIVICAQCSAVAVHLLAWGHIIIMRTYHDIHAHLFTCSSCSLKIKAGAKLQILRDADLKFFIRITSHTTKKQMFSESETQFITAKSAQNFKQNHF